ncbi:MAG: cyclic nucleotide-binding domain-containing protein [Beijerinckiaceae bacterium]
MRPDDIASIKNLSLIAGLGDSERDRLLQGAYLQWFPAHVELIREGEPPDFLYVVIEGQVELFAHHRDRENTITVVGPHSAFIVAAVMLNRPYLKSARVLVSSRILMIPADNVRQTFNTVPVFAQAIARELAMAFRSVVKELKNQKLRSTIERTAAWLIRQNIEQGMKGRIELGIEKKILASRLGMAPEVLSRTFVTLKQYGVEVQGKTVTLNDLDSLRKLAVPDDLIDDPLH